MIDYGKAVLLYSSDGKSFLIKLQKGGKFHSHLGVVDHDLIAESDFGSTVASAKGAELYVLEPTTEDYIMNVARRTQIMYPKDIGLALLKAGVGPGSRVVELGSGSGALTIALARAVAPGGRVYSYDRNEQFQQVARANLERAGLADYVEFKIREVGSGFDETEADVVMLDVPNPWDGADDAWRALKGGGRLASFSPTFNQVERMAEKLERSGFVAIETVEVLHRYILARPGRTRPFNRMVGHTGFMTFARKVIKKETGARSQNIEQEQ